MARADCAICGAAGYRSCDFCGNPVFPPFTTSPLGVDRCAYCVADGVGAGPRKAGAKQESRQAPARPASTAGPSRGGA